MRYHLVIMLLTALCLYSCSGVHKNNAEGFDTDVYTPKYAKGFDIKGAEGRESVIITVNNPWQGADSVTSQLFISRNGENAPDGFDGQVINGNANRVIAMSSTQVAMLDAINESNRIVGVSGIDYISNENIQSRRDEVGDIGFEGNINYELLLSLEPDIVLLYAVNGPNAMEDKLKELGIPYMYVGDYLENSPLGKAEWLVALAEIIGNRNNGEEFFSGIPERYDQLKEIVANNASPSPKVMINAPYGDSWFMPSSTSYAACLIADAGGDLVYANNNGNQSVPIDIEEAYRLTADADVWINPGMAGSLDDVKKMCPNFTDTDCFRNGKIYNNNLRLTEYGGNDYFESGVVRPDIVLRDLIKIFHPELVVNDFVYYRQLK